MEAWELRERYLKAGQNEAGAKNRKRGEKGESLSASEFLKSFGGESDGATKRRSDEGVDAEEEALLAELEREEAEEDKETGRQGDKERQETRRSNSESNPKLEVRNSGLSTQGSGLSQHPATTNKQPPASSCESSADVAARMATPPGPPAAPPPPYSISDELVKAWDRIVDHLRKNPEELYRRLARRRTRTLMQPPRNWCLCIRAADTRINSFTAACAPSDAAYPRSHLGPNVVFTPEPHEVTIDKPLLRKLCMPVHLPRGYNEVTEVADLVGASHTQIRQLIRRGHFAVKRVPRLEGRHGWPVPLISVPWPLDPCAFNLRPPDPLWDLHWPIMVSYVPDDFEQLLVREPRFMRRARPKRRQNRPHQTNQTRQTNRARDGQFMGWDWRCPGCGKLVDRLYYPLPARQMVLLNVSGVERDELDKLPSYCQTFACGACHGVWHFSRDRVAWIRYVAYMSGGLLYGSEVPPPPDYHLAPPRREIDPPAIDPYRLAPRRPARRSKLTWPRRQAAPKAEEVIPLFLKNMSRQEIARELGITVSSVDHRLDLLRKRYHRKSRTTLFTALLKKYPQWAQGSQEYLRYVQACCAPRKRASKKGSRNKVARKRFVVLRMILEGQPLEKIAQELQMSSRAVREHVLSLYSHYGVQSPWELREKVSDRAVQAGGTGRSPRSGDIPAPTASSLQPAASAARCRSAS